MHIAFPIPPILPDINAKLAAQFNLHGLASLALADTHWGLLPDGHTTGEL